MSLMRMLQACRFWVNRTAFFQSLYAPFLLRWGFGVGFGAALTEGAAHDERYTNTRPENGEYTDDYYNEVPHAGMACSIRQPARPQPSRLQGLPCLHAVERGGYLVRTCR